MGNQLFYFPLSLEVRDGVGVMKQRVGDLEDEYVEILISKDQAVKVAEFLMSEFKISKSRIVKGSEEGFDKFWDAYPNKTAKVEALISWKKMNLCVELDRILNHVEISKRSDQWARGFIPHAVTYLNQRRFEDDFTKDVDQFAGAL